MTTPIIIHDRDWEVLSRLAISELGAKNDLEVYNFLKDYDNKGIKTDAETYVNLCKLSKEESGDYFSEYHRLKNLDKAVLHRLGYDEPFVGFYTNIMKKIILSRINGYPDCKTAREFFIKNSKEYKECKSDEERNRYVNEHY